MKPGARWYWFGVAYLEDIRSNVAPFPRCDGVPLTILEEGGAILGVVFCRNLKENLLRFLISDRSIARVIRSEDKDKECWF